MSSGAVWARYFSIRDIIKRTVAWPEPSDHLSNITVEYSPLEAQPEANISCSGEQRLSFQSGSQSMETAGVRALVIASSSCSKLA